MNKTIDWRERFREKLNNAHITGHISGRHLILLGGKKDTSSSAKSLKANWSNIREIN